MGGADRLASCVEGEETGIASGISLNERDHRNNQGASGTTLIVKDGGGRVTNRDRESRLWFKRQLRGKGATPWGGRGTRLMTSATMTAKRERASTKALRGG